MAHRDSVSVEWHTVMFGLFTGVLCKATCTPLLVDIDTAAGYIVSYTIFIVLFPVVFVPV